MRSIFIALACLVTATGVHAQDRDRVTTFTLDNGLEAVVIEDNRAPVVVHMMWYKVGSADETAGKSGIAHFLEHLMFKGTDELEPGEFSETVAANGGSDNAFTSFDYTAYFQRVASDRLGLMMRMEADRMRDLVLDDEDMLTERDVVVEERAQRTDSNPGALFNEQRRAAQYLNHPYGRPIIGWRDEVSALTLQDALDFYALHYAPNNAVLVVAGDVDPDEVRALAEQHYGPVAPSDDLPPRARPAEPEHLSARHLTMEDERVSNDYVVRTWLVPERDSGAQEKAAAYSLLAALLGGNSATSHMGQLLEQDEKVAIYTEAFYSGLSLDDTLFGIVVVPTSDRSLEDAEADMERALASFIAEGIDTAKLERLKAQVRASEIYGQDSLEGRARNYGAALTSGLTVADVQAWPSVLEAVTEEDVIAAAKTLLDLRNSVTGYLMKPTPVEETQ